MATQRDARANRIGFYAYCKAGGSGTQARCAYERATFECLLALRWLTERLEKEDSTKD